jgi:hypothetical protein
MEFTKNTIKNHLFVKVESYMMSDSFVSDQTISLCDETGQVLICPVEAYSEWSINKAKPLITLSDRLSYFSLIDIWMVGRASDTSWTTPVLLK